jgi:hypothetical protein
LSPFFYKLANSFFLDSNATVQINVDSNNIYLRTQVYYPTHNRLQISLIRADPLLNVLASDRINIPFDKENEQLQQLLILDEEHLLILKQLRNDVAENLLVVVKCNLKSGKMTATQFNLHYSLFSQPALYYNAVDSSIFIYAMVRESLMSQGNKRSVFMCKMNDSLEVVEPATLLKSPNLFSFFLVKDVKPDWIHFFDFRLGYHNWRVMSNWSSGRYYKQELYPYMDNNLPAIRGSGYFSETNGRNSNKVRFAVVDQQFKILSDSALVIDDKAFSIRVSNFGKIQWKNQSYIIMEQQLPRKNTGLVLITNNKNILEITDLPVYNRYRYLLSQLQQARDESVIIPYIDKDKVGLMRLKMN